MSLLIFTLKKMTYKIKNKNKNLSKCFGRKSPTFKSAVERDIERNKREDKNRKKQGRKKRK